MVKNISHIARKLWFPTAVGWAAYLLVFLLVLLAMMGYPSNHHTIVNNVANNLCIYLGPILLLGGAAAHILSMVRSTRALITGKCERVEGIIAACLSWGWFALACLVAFVVIRAMYF